MSISSIGSAVATQVAQKAPAVSQSARAADGDYLTPGAGRSTVKDNDGDYKATPVKVSTSPQAAPSSSTQAALSSLKLGG
ncbi:hypothetical protein [Beijerinckia indica]|nr:hypothetical protein [Beijerinckia indica]